MKLKQIKDLSKFINDNIEKGCLSSDDKVEYIDLVVNSRKDIYFQRSYEGKVLISNR